MVFEDVTNIALLCALLGLGVIATIGLLFAYLAALAFMEDHFD
jgi:hypothetical protein